MFGPNTHFTSNSSIDFSHRDKLFIKLFKRVREKFIITFNLDEYDILFIPGSGTIGIESVFYSVNKPIKVIGNEGVFKKKWEMFSKQYSQKRGSLVELFCQLETSNSSIFTKENSIVDAISSFPYYNLPKKTKIFISCSNKQLGSFPGLAIVGVNKGYWKNLKSANEFSYLNLSRYLDYNKVNQTPSTTPTQIFNHLEFVLDNFSLSRLKEKINNNAKKIVNAIGEENVIGEVECPVITIKKELIPTKLANKYDLYGSNTSNPYYQIFTYSCDDEIYDTFCKELKK